MSTINELRYIIKHFEKRNIGLQELQDRLATVTTPKPDYYNLNVLLSELDNELEEIIYTKLETNYYQYGLQVIKDFLQKLYEIDKNS